MKKSRLEVSLSVKILLMVLSLLMLSSTAHAQVCNIPGISRLDLSVFLLSSRGNRVRIDIPRRDITSQFDPSIDTFFVGFNLDLREIMRRPDFRAGLQRVTVISRNGMDRTREGIVGVFTRNRFFEQERAIQGQGQRVRISLRPSERNKRLVNAMLFGFNVPGRECRQQGQ